MAEADLSLAARRVEAGDRAQFRVIVEHTQRSLFRLAARITGSTSEAEDVVQEAYIKAFRALTDGQFDRRAGLGTWLYRVVTNTAIDHLRRRAVRPAGTDDKLETTTTPDNDPEAHLALKELSDWLSELPPDQRAAVGNQHDLIAILDLGGTDHGSVAGAGLDTNDALSAAAV